MKEKKIVSIEDRIPKLKERRKKKAIRRYTSFISLFVLLISVIVYLLTPLSHVKTIEVIGSEYVSDESVVEQSGLTTESNIWAIKRKDIQETLEVNPVIKTAKVSRKLPRSIEITIEEYKHVGYIQTNNDFNLVLENGVALSEVIPYTGDAPIIEGFIEEDYFKQMVAELKELPRSILNLISEIHWQPTDENKHKIILYMNDGFVVDGTMREFSEKMKIYPSLVSQLEPDSEGIIHIGVGAYFEKYEKKQDKE